MYEPNYSSLIEYLQKSSDTWGDKEALVIRRRIKKEKIFYKNIPYLINQFEVWFQNTKIPRDSKLLFWGMSCPEYAIALLSCMSLGRVAIPIDWRNSKETIDGIIEKTKPKYAFVSKYFKHDFLIEKGIKIFFIEDIAQLLADIPANKRILPKNKDYLNPERIVEIVFTSGTTGTPKGVVMKQKNILANLKSVESSLPDLTGSRTISILPLSHMLEQVGGLLLPLGYGTTIFYLPRINSFRLLQAFSEYKPTHLVFVPQMMKMLWGRIEDKARQTNKYTKLVFALKFADFLPRIIKKRLFSSIHELFGGELKYIACGGAPLDKNIGINWFKVGLPIVEGYGATEATAIATVNNVNSPKLGTVGKPVPGVDIKIDKEGEIYIQSESLSAGYFNDSKKTKEAFTKNGYKTGDIGEFDREGNLHIKGRDVFKIVLPSGEKVYVEDLETKIFQDTQVKEACVVAVRTSGGDKIHAYFILKKETKGSLKEIVSGINDRLESKQQILSFDVWPYDDFPRTPTLKIDRKLVYAVANEQKSMSTISENALDSAYSIQDIVDVLSKVSGIEKDRILDTDTLAGDLSIDSLTRVEVGALAEEHLGIILDEGKINSKTTVADLKIMAKNSEVVEEVKLPTWQFNKVGEFLHYLSIKYFLAPLHSTIIKIKYDQSPIPHIKPGSVIIFNHPGILDAVCVVRTLLRQGSNLVVTNAGANFWNGKSPLAKPLELFVGGIPLYDSGHKLMRVLQTDSDLLDRGYNLLFAPQGALQTSPEEKPFKLGIGYIIQQLDCPVHILKIEGYFDVWPVPPKGLEKSSILDLLPRKTGTVTVKVSPEIKHEWQNMTPIQVTNLLEEKYEEL